MAQLGQRLGPEGREDEELLTREPWEQTVADQAVAEMGREQAQCAAEAREPEVLVQACPARAKRAVRVQDPFRLSGRARREQDQSLSVVRPGAAAGADPLAPGAGGVGLGALETLDAKTR